ncbi:hypothetical protein [Haloarcula amylovorans]|nr:hypothetical protein [Halomicroarcula amylolytica]
MSTNDLPDGDVGKFPEAAGIGPHRAGQAVGAAVANNLTESAVRGESDD